MYLFLPLKIVLKYEVNGNGVIWFDKLAVCKKSQFHCFAAIGIFSFSLQLHRGEL